MIGKRILQLIIQTILMAAVCVYTIQGFMDHHFSVREILMATGPAVALVPLAASLRLNWLLLKSQKLIVRLPRRSMPHYALIVLTAMIIYFASSLGFFYDEHLSSYNLYARFPDWLWLPWQVGRFELGIAATKLGISMFVLYVFVFMLIITLHTLGLFSYDASPGREFQVISRTLLLFQIILAAALIFVVLVGAYEFCFTIRAFFQELKFDEGLLNTWNIGCYLFSFLSLILVSFYATYILFDGIQLWKANSIR